MSEREFLTDGNEIVSQVRNFFEQATVIKCAVAFWGNRAPFLLGLRGLNKPIRIICNLESGATNPTVIRELLDIPQLEIRSHELLHAKVYWTEQGAIIGSSNASSNGLSYEGYETNSWIEANISVTNPKILTHIENWFDELWKKSNPVDLTQLRQIERLWRRRRNIRRIPGTKPNSSLLTALRQNQDSFKNRDIYVVIYRKIFTPEAKKTFQNWKAQQKFGASSSKVMCFEGWAHLPTDATVVVLYYGSRGSVRYEGCYRLPEPQFDIKFKYTGGGYGHITIAFACEDVSELVVKEDDEALFKSKVEQLYNSSKATLEGEGRIISLYDAYSILL